MGWLGTSWTGLDFRLVDLCSSNLDNVGGYKLLGYKCFGHSERIVFIMTGFMIIGFKATSSMSNGLFQNLDLRWKG